MGKNSANTIDMLKANLKEGVKTHHVYDGQSRVSEVYEASVSTSVGDPCLVTVLIYIGVSQQVVNTIEYKNVWTAAMEAALPANPTPP